MKENTVLNITIPRPCYQNWDAMTNVDEGKYCTQCNNIVYDFSQMNDEELLNFFNRRSAIPCGRFHITQLNRDIVPVIAKKKMLLHRFNKIAAAIFTVLSFKGMSSNAGVKNTTIEFDANYKNRIKAANGKIIISGIIKDSHGAPLEKAIIQFDSAQVATTDKEGKFNFELDEVTAISHNLYFSYGDLITVVRNYHPAMLAANYDVVLKDKADESHILMGAPPPPIILDDLPSLKFKTNVFKLSADNKAMLATIASKMKSNPFATITVTAYADGGRSHQSIYVLRVDNIKKYLVEKEGVSPDRITTNVEPGTGDKNTVDVKSAN